MKLTYFYTPLFIFAYIVFGTNAVSAKKSYQFQEPIPHDSLMALNEKAFSLIFTNPDSTQRIADVVYKISLRQNDTLAIAKSLMSKASGNWAEAKYNLSLKLFFDALYKYEMLKDTTGMLRCYNDIAEVYKKLKNYPNAIRYLNKTRNLFKLFYEEEYPILNYLNTAELLIDLKLYDSASYYLDMAKNAPTDQISINYLATINFDFAILNKDTLNFDLAKTFIEQSIHFAKLINNDRRLAEAYNILGEVFYDLNKLDEADTNFEKAYSLSQKLHHEQLEIRLQKNFYKLELKNGETDNAISHLLQYANLKDKIYTISISRQSAEFEAVYELEKVEKENSILQLKQNASSNIIKYQIGFIILALLALLVAFYLIIALNKQRKSLKEALAQLEIKRKLIESQKIELEKQTQNSEALNSELTLLNKNLESRAQVIAREIEDKNKKMNQYAFMNAHKLRAPIASILGLINLFGKNLGNIDEKKMIGMLKDSADKLDVVVHEIKDVIDE